jgi:uncharacterized membrane protein
MELWQLVAHRHWYTLSFLGREFRLCARCSGYFVGLSTLIILLNFGLPIFHSLKVDLQFFFCFLCILPLAFDWITQSWGWRESNNNLRFFTGFILGVGTSLFYSMETISFSKMRIYVYIAASIAVSGIVGKHIRGLFRAIGM